MKISKKARVIAFYLPQFHPIPENDKHWGKGFTEWTNVGKAQPLFKGHYQPRVPADLGYYDLRLPEVREAQAEMAREAGVEGFCYWHYWFGNGKKLLEHPFQEVLKTGKPDLPFCLGWANHSWTTKTWEKRKTSYKDEMIVEQLYPGEEDYIAHFNYVLPAFKDERYITVDGKPIFLVFDPLKIPNSKKFIDLWQSLAKENGLKGIHFVGSTENSGGKSLSDLGKKRYKFLPTQESDKYYDRVLNLGFDAVASLGLYRAESLVGGKFRRLLKIVLKRVFKVSLMEKYQYKSIMKNYYVKEDSWENVYPSLLPQWDKSARSGTAKGIYINSTPELFQDSIEEVLKLVQDKKDEHKILFLKSWNEWAEGNYVEPDLKFGNGYLKALKNTLITD